MYKSNQNDSIYYLALAFCFKNLNLFDVCRFEVRKTQRRNDLMTQLRIDAITQICMFDKRRFKVSVQSVGSKFRFKVSIQSYGFKVSV